MTNKQKCKGWRPFLYCAASYAMAGTGRDTYSIVDGSTGKRLTDERPSEAESWEAAWALIEPEIAAAASHQAQPED